jgi:hypothetical protein
MAATMGGQVEATGAVFEAKFMLPWSISGASAAEKRMAQLRHNVDHGGEKRGFVHHHRWRKK